VDACAQIPRPQRLAFRGTASWCGSYQLDTVKLLERLGNLVVPPTGEPVPFAPYARENGFLSRVELLDLRSQAIRSSLPTDHDQPNIYHSHTNISLGQLRMDTNLIDLFPRLRAVDVGGGVAGEDFIVRGSHSNSHTCGRYQHTGGLLSRVALPRTMAPPVLFALADALDGEDFPEHPSSVGLIASPRLWLLCGPMRPIDAPPSVILGGCPMDLRFAGLGAPPKPLDEDWVARASEGALPSIFA